MLTIYLWNKVYDMLNQVVIYFLLFQMDFLRVNNQKSFMNFLKKRLSFKESFNYLRVCLKINKLQKAS